MKINKRLIVQGIGFFLIISIMGCDQLSSISEYFNKSKNKKETPAAKVEQQIKKTEIKSSQKMNKKISANTLAQVGDWSITIEEFNDRLKALKEAVPDYDIKSKESKALVLEELVRQQLLVEEAKKTGLINQKDIKSAVEEFQRTLIVREMAKKLTENITVTDKEARDFYEEKKDVLVAPAQWKVREIVFKTQQKANEVLIEILKGANFSDMAKQYSIGKSAVNSGDLGFLTDVPFEQMANPLLSLEVGDVSSVFKGPEGFYIIKLEEKKGGEPLAFKDIKEEIIKNQKLLKQQKAILDHLDKLKKEIKVEINEKLLQ